MARPVQQHVQNLAGKVLWVNPPFNIVGPVLDAVVQAWRAAPSTTTATIVVPQWPETSWFRKYLRRKHPLMKVLHIYPAGSKIFRAPGSSFSPPSKDAIMVLRLGNC